MLIAAERGLWRTPGHRGIQRERAAAVVTTLRHTHVSLLLYGPSLRPLRPAFGTSSTCCLRVNNTLHEYVDDLRSSRTVAAVGACAWGLRASLVLCEHATLLQSVLAHHHQPRQHNEPVLLKPRPVVNRRWWRLSLSALSAVLAGTTALLPELLRHLLLPLLRLLLLRLLGSTWLSTHDKQQQNFSCAELTAAAPSW